MADPAYGYAHQKERAAAIAAMVDGTRCPFCRKPMFKAKARLLDYDHVIPVALGGMDGPKRLSHRTCNRRAGAVMGNRMRGSYVNSPSFNRRRAPPKGKVANRKRQLPKW